MKRIHNTAVIDPEAVIGQGVEIGPFSIVEAGTVIGDGCRLASHVVIKRGTTLGNDNEVCEGAVLGGKPQHVAPGDHSGPLIIGHGNVIRENVTIHRALTASQSTVVGDQNLIMVNAHVAHDCRVGSHTIIANNVMMAGHVTLGDYAYLSGAVGIHQFCRVGAHAMVGGQAHVTKDIPPYVTVDGMTTRVVGLNVIGLRRRGYSREDLTQLKAAYRIIYRQGLTWAEVLDVLKHTFSSGPASDFHPFFAHGHRGFVLERRTPAAALVRLSRVSMAEEPAARRKAG